VRTLEPQHDSSAHPAMTDTPAPPSPGPPPPKPRALSVDEWIRAWTEAADRLDEEATELRARAVTAAKRAATYRALAAAFDNPYPR